MSIIDSIKRIDLRLAEDGEDSPSDLLCDIMHWCDANGESFAELLESAQTYYEEERDAIADAGEGC